jgi:hypothetical protein
MICKVREGHFRPIRVPYGTTSVNIWREKFMLRPKVQKILNEKFRDHSNVYLVISGIITLS